MVFASVDAVVARWDWLVAVVVGAVEGAGLEAASWWVRGLRGAPGRLGRVETGPGGVGLLACRPGASEVFEEALVDGLAWAGGRALAGVPRGEASGAVAALLEVVEMGDVLLDAGVVVSGSAVEVPVGVRGSVRGNVYRYRDRETAREALVAGLAGLGCPERAEGVGLFRDEDGFWVLKGRDVESLWGVLPPTGRAWAEAVNGSLAESAAAEAWWEVFGGLLPRCVVITGRELVEPWAPGGEGPAPVVGVWAADHAAAGVAS